MVVTVIRESCVRVKTELGRGFPAFSAMCPERVVKSTVKKLVVSEDSPRWALAFSFSSTGEKVKRFHRRVRSKPSVRNPRLEGCENSPAKKPRAAQLGTHKHTLVWGEGLGGRKKSPGHIKKILLT